MRSSNARQNDVVRGLTAVTTPIRNGLFDCCARTTTGHANAAPPRTLRNSRRRISAPRLRRLHHNSSERASGRGPSLLQHAMLVEPNGIPGITLSPGERFHVDLVNQAGTSTIMHWHGQLPPWKQDGFPWPQTPPIPAG